MAIFLAKMLNFSRLMIHWQKKACRQIPTSDIWGSLSLCQTDRSDISSTNRRKWNDIFLPTGKEEKWLLPFSIPA